MRKTLLVAFMWLAAIFAYPQKPLYTYNFNVKPSMGQTAGGIWKKFVINYHDEPNDTNYSVSLSVDSTYISVAGWPDYGDLKVPDLEVKAKSLWYGDSIFFLFQRLDDNMITGYNQDGSADQSVKPGLENRDASTLYFYFSCDSARLTSDYNFSDSIAWLRFGWQSDDIQGRLLSGDTVNNISDFPAEIVQWYTYPYYYAKVAVSIAGLAPFFPHIMDSLQNKLGVSYMGFAMDVCENDKEVGPSPFGLQTRVYWPLNMEASAVDNVSKWGWLWCFQDTLQYTSIKYNTIDIASVYPNPAGEYINVKLLQGYACSYKLVDITGRVILSGRFNDMENTIDIHELVAGAYFMVLNDKKGNYATRKILVVR